MRKIIFRIYWYFKSKRYNYPTNPTLVLKKLLKSQYWSKSQTEAYQLKCLNELATKASNNTEYYKKLNIQEYLPIESIHDFTLKIPSIDRVTIMANVDKLKIKKPDSFFKYSTSGSTGEPLTVEISGMSDVYRIAGHMRFHRWWGIKPFSKSVLIWGFKSTSKKEKKSFVNIIKRQILNRLDINVFDLNEQTIEFYFNKIEKFKPAFIKGYKSAVYQLAELMYSKNLSFKNPTLKVAIVTSEVLLENERAFIEKVLKCKVANEYGAVEAGLFAYECPNGSMHIFEESVFIDTIDKSVVSTELYNDYMPLINYQNGDKVILSNKLCSCGRTSRIINRIEGRVDDMVVRPDGTKISQYIFYYIMKEINDIGYEGSVKKYLVVQKENDFNILVVPGANYGIEVEKFIKQRMYKEIGSEIQIDIKKVTEIKREKSGKLRFFIRQ